MALIGAPELEGIVDNKGIHVAGVKPRCIGICDVGGDHALSVRGMGRGPGSKA